MGVLRSAARALARQAPSTGGTAATRASWCWPPALGAATHRASARGTYGTYATAVASVLRCRQDAGGVSRPPHSTYGFTASVSVFSTPLAPAVMVTFAGDVPVTVLVLSGNVWMLAPWAMVVEDGAGTTAGLLLVTVTVMGRGLSLRCQRYFGSGAGRGQR